MDHHTNFFMTSKLSFHDQYTFFLHPKLLEN